MAIKVGYGAGLAEMFDAERAGTMAVDRSLGGPRREPLQTLRYVLLPQMIPAIVTGAVLALTLSFDETLISVFLAGDQMTLPLRLWAMMRIGFTAEINALVTIVLAVSIFLTMVAALCMRSTMPGARQS